MKLLAAAAGLLAATSLSAGCGSAYARSGGGGGTILVYSGQHPQTTQDLVAAFEKATGAHVAVRYNDEDFLAAEIVEEASHPKADVFYAENSPALEYLQERGLLAHLGAAVLANTPAKYDSPSGDWVGVSARVSVLVYDLKLIGHSQLPAHALEMGLPRYRGMLALAPLETDFQPVVTSMELAYGRARTLAWLRGLKANASGHIYSTNEAVTSAVNSGAAAFGLVDQYYWYRLRAALGRASTVSRIAYFAPRDPGYVLDVSGAAVLSSSKHKALAERFVSFLVSKEGQEIIAKSDSFEYPLDDGVKPKAAETPFNQLEPYPVSVAQLGDGTAARSLLREAGLQ
jgi:iron(III) transport system substrate-binding protein